MERLIEWPARAPAADDSTTVAHGDFRPGNVIMHETEPRGGRGARLGALPLAIRWPNLRLNAMPYRLGMEWDGFRGKDLGCAGLPSEEGVHRGILPARGTREHSRVGLVRGLRDLRLAAIAQGIMGRVIAGTANDPRPGCAASGPSPLADAAGRSCRGMKR